MNTFKQEALKILEEIKSSLEDSHSWLLEFYNRTDESKLNNAASDVQLKINEITKLISKLNNAELKESLDEEKEILEKLNQFKESTKNLNQTIQDANVWLVLTENVTEEGTAQMQKNINNLINAINKVLTELNIASIILNEVISMLEKYFILVLVLENDLTKLDNNLEVITFKAYYNTNSPIAGYIIEPTKITIRFKTGKEYIYNTLMYGERVINEIISLAESNNGLMRFLNTLK